MASCFIIMPVTTPERMVPLYGQDAKHFIHVLEHLFVPAVKRADFNPIQPIAQGADVIHAEIVKNLETADLVLCDISSLNPNVFFELGCRTALNKPVCYVMDDLTRGIPFDTGIINHHTYSHALAPWTLEAEIELLAAHVRASASRSAGKNMLWEYFGLRSVAHAVATAGDDKDRLEYLVMQVEAVRKALEDRSTGNAFVSSYSAGPYENAWTEMKTEPWSPQMFAGGTQFLHATVRDWEQVIKDSENDLQQVKLFQRPDKTRVDLTHVKGIIEEHIKSLSELIDSEPQTERAAKARDLQDQFRAILVRR